MENIWSVTDGLKWKTFGVTDGLKWKTFRPWKVNFILVFRQIFLEIDEGWMCSFSHFYFPMRGLFTLQ